MLSIDVDKMLLHIGKKLSNLIRISTERRWWLLYVYFLLWNHTFGMQTGLPKGGVMGVIYKLFNFRTKSIRRTHCRRILIKMCIQFVRYEILCNWENQTFSTQLLNRFFFWKFTYSRGFTLKYAKPNAELWRLQFHEFCHVDSQNLNIF